MKALYFGLGVLLSTVACEEGLEVQTVIGLRVLGARVESASDESVAEPAPGEAVHVEWLVVSDEVEAYTALFWACNSTAATRGLDECSSAPFHEASATSDTANGLAFDFDLPDLPTNGDWLAKLSVCVRGQAEFTREGVARCSDGSEPLEAQTRVRVPDGEPNHHPDISDDRLTLGGENWTTGGANAIGEACDADPDAMLPEVRRGKKVNIRLRSVGDDREALPEAESERYGAKPNESLVFAHFATVPGLDRAFSALEGDSDEDRFDVDLKIDDDASIGRDGTIAEFVLVVRDDRGGADWLVRRMCARR